MTESISLPSQSQRDKTLVNKESSKTSDTTQVTPVALAGFEQIGGFFERVRQGIDLQAKTCQLKGRIKSIGEELSALDQIIDSQQAIIKAQDQILLKGNTENIDARQSFQRHHRIEKLNEKFQSLPESQTALSKPSTSRETPKGIFYLFKQILYLFGALTRDLDHLKQEHDKWEDILSLQIEKMGPKVTERGKKIDNQFSAISTSEESIDEKKILQNEANKSSRKRRSIQAELDKIIRTQRAIIEAQKQLLPNLKKVKVTGAPIPSKVNHSFERRTKQLTKKFEDVRKLYTVSSETSRCQEIERQFCLINQFQREVHRKTLPQDRGFKKQVSFSL